MSLAEDINRLIKNLIETKSYEDEQKHSVLELYTRAVVEGHTDVCQHLEAAYDANNHGQAVIRLGAALRGLSTAPSVSMSLSVNASEVNIGCSPGLTHSDDGDVRVYAVDDVPASLEGDAENGKAETNKRKRTVKRGEPLRPTSHELQYMRETLGVLAERWEGSDETRFGHTKPDPQNKDRKLPTIKLKDGSVVVLYRTICLHTSEKYKILPHGKMNLEKRNSRQSKLWEDKGTLERLGLFRIDETDEMDTNIGLIDSHKYPDHKGQRGYKTRKVLALCLVGATETQIRDTPSVSVRGGTVTLNLHKYIETELLPTLQHESVAPKFEEEGEKVPVKVNKWPTKNKSRSAMKVDTRLRIRQDLCRYGERRLDNLVTFLETALTPADLKWFKKTVLPLQESRDSRLLEAIKTGNKLTHHTLERVHRKCRNPRDGEVQCDFGSLEECRHDHCPGVECKSETLLLKGCWYLIDLCDTVDHNTGLMKDDQRKKRDNMKVHPHSNRAQTTSMQVYYKTWRDFCEWYTIAVHDLLGKEQFGDQQATVPSLMFSPHLVSLVEEFIESVENSPSTKHNKIKLMKDILDSGAAYTSMDLHKGADWLDEERKKNQTRMEVLLKFYSQDGPSVRRNTDLRLSSTAAGKAPGFDRVDGAFRYHREGMFSKIKAQKGKGIIPVAVQRFLLLGLIRSLIGARPGMYAHMGFGTNLKSVSMLKSNKEVNHQKAKKKRSIKGKLVVDEEEEADRYAKAIAIEFLQLMKDRVPADQRFELKHQVLLEATSKKRYGYKNGHINKRVLPFHRHRSMLFIVYAASVLYVRQGTPDDVATHAGDFLQHYEATSYDTDSAYQWLEEHGQVDFVRSLCEYHGNSCRVFYRSDEDFLYGSHAEDSTESQNKETAIATHVTNMIKEAMRMYYESLDEGDIELNELCDGTLDWVEFITGKAADGYTTRGVRSATADHISRRFPDMPYDVKELLVQQTMMHTLETHETVYVRDARFLRCSTLRDWMERGAPMPEFEKVMEQTTDEMRLGESIKFREPPKGNGVTEFPSLIEEGPQAKKRRRSLSAAHADSAEDAANDTDHIPAPKSKDRRNPLEDKVNEFIRHSSLLDEKSRLTVMTGNGLWHTCEVTYRSSDDGRGEPYVQIKATGVGRKPKDIPDMLWWPVFETWGGRVKLEDNRTWAEHVAASCAAPST